MASLADLTAALAALRAQAPDRAARLANEHEVLFSTLDRHPERLPPRTLDSILRLIERELPASAEFAQDLIAALDAVAAAEQQLRADPSEAHAQTWLGAQARLDRLRRPRA